MNLKDFAEIKYYKKRCVVFLVGDIVFFLILLIFYFVFERDNYMLYIASLTLLTIPIFVYYLYRYFSVKIGMKSYDIYTIKFKEPIANFLSRGRHIAFTFDLIIDGVKMTKKTRSIFSSFFPADLKIDNYKKEVLIAYNKYTDDVVVVGPKY